MNDFCADPPAMQTHGHNVAVLGTNIGKDIDGSKPNLDCPTPGLNTPGVLAGVVAAWSDVCHAVSGEVKKAGVGTTMAGRDHEQNDHDQECGFKPPGK